MPHFVVKSFIPAQPKMNRARDHYENQYPVTSFVSVSFMTDFNQHHGEVPESLLRQRLMSLTDTKNAQYVPRG